MKKIYSFFSALLIGTACLFAQTAPDGYIAKGAFTESFTDASTVSKMGWGWGWQDGDPSKSYSISSSTTTAINGKYIFTSSYYLQTDQTTPTLLITPALIGKVKFYIRPNGTAEWSMTNCITPKKSWVQIYVGHLFNGSIQWDEAPTYTRLFTETKPENSDENWWTLDSMTIEDDYAFLGIQLSYACFDELTADDYCLPIKRVMTPTALASEWTDSNPLYGDAEGKTTWTGSVTVQNNGDLPFANGEAVLNITSSSTSVTTTTVTSFTIPDAIAPGESKTYDISVPLQLVDITKEVRTAIKFTSNLNNVTTSLPYKQSEWFTIKAYAPKLTVRNASNSDVTSYATALGLVEAPASTTFTLKNIGGSPLVLKSITSTTLSNLEFTCEGAEGSIFPLTIKRGTDTTITMTFGNTGGQSGTLVFTYGNTYDDAAEYTLESKEISVVVADPDLYLEQFGATLPQGWVNEEGSNWSIKNSSTNYYMTNSLQDMPGKYLISPKLHFEEGQTLAIMAQRKGSSGSGLRVLTSTDRVNWTLALEKTAWTKSYSGSLNTSYTELVAVHMPEGDVYVAFEAGYSIMDYVLGGTKVDVEDDIYATLSGADNAMVNYPYELGVELLNLTETEYVEALALELLNGETVVAELDVDTLHALGTLDTLALRFTPHVAENATLTLRLKKGENVMASLTKAIHVAAEEANSEAVTGTQTSTSSYAPFYTNYVNSKSEFVYKAVKLGLEANTKLTSITFNYYKTTDEISRNVKIWLQNTADTIVGDTFTDVSKMTLVFSDDDYLFKKEGFSSACVDQTFAFSAPFVYTGGNLRVVAACENESGYKSSGYGYENVANSVLYKYNDNKSNYESASATKANYLPVAKIGFAVELPTISGKVDLKSGNNAGRTITAKSGDVLYKTTTDEQGNYTLEIMQVMRQYDIYLDDECKAQNISVEAGSVVVNITDVVTDCEQTLLNAPAATKHIINGMLIIQRGDKCYNANGQVLK